MTRVAEVAVIGAGPAGSVAARLLATWGHEVVLIEREGGRRELAESLPPSCIPLLDTAGVRDAVDGAGFIRATGNTVWWGGAPMRVEAFPGDAAGYQVPRSRLDAVLAASAVAAGAVPLRPATALRVTAAGEEQVVALATEEGPREVRARWVLDCSGRTGVAARASRLSPAGGLRTMALVGEWERRGGWPVPDETHTLVESTEWGWGWSVPLTLTTRCVTVMMDPVATPLAPGPELDDRYRSLLARLPALGGLVQGATPIGNAWACDATPYEAREVGQGRTLLVGDAASFIDPLSSFGVKKAIASAWLAAVAVHTDLVTPATGAAAVDLFRAREAAYVRGAARELGAVSRQAHDEGAPGFWAARASLHADEEEAASVERLRADPDVVTAFGVLRESGPVQLLRSPELRTELRPVVRGNLVVLDDHVVVPGLGESLRYLRNIDLAVVLEVAVGTDDVGEMYTRYTRRLGPASLPDFLGALSVLLGKGGLLLA